MALGKRIKQARKRKGLSQARLAELTGSLQATISALEKNDSKSSRNSLALARALEVRTTWLMTGEGPMELDSPEDDIDTLIPRAELFKQLSAAYEEIARLEAENKALKKFQNDHGTEEDE